MTRGHHITMSTDLTVRQSAIRAPITTGPSAVILGGRRRVVSLGMHVSAGGAHGGGGTGTDAHVLHARTHALQLQVADFLFEELDVPACLAHLAIETRPNGIVVSLLSHSIGAIEQTLLPLYLLVNICDSFVFIHLGGVFVRRHARDRVERFFVCRWVWFLWLTLVLGFGFSFVFVFLFLFCFFFGVEQYCRSKLF